MEHYFKEFRTHDDESGSTSVVCDVRMVAMSYWALFE